MVLKVKVTRNSSCAGRRCPAACAARPSSMTASDSSRQKFSVGSRDKPRLIPLALVEPHPIKSVQAPASVTVLLVVARVEGVDENQNVVVKFFGRAKVVATDDNSPVSAELHVLKNNRLSLQKISLHELHQIFFVEVTVAEKICRRKNCGGEKFFYGDASLNAGSQISSSREKFWTARLPKRFAVKKIAAAKNFFMATPP